MWVQIRTAPNLIVAEMWKEFFEGEGIPTRLLVDPDSPTSGVSATYRVLIPEEKDHVVEEILRKA
ncbi:MAG: hypothetical protein DRI39_05290 [Chloroflexi bacterium]|nr:MAG: hypothetical protein DRI39_05290 [Chloroflexota bacterium]RLC95806.1 MAG: hypothetical protein DRI40_04875 [Chloroflexota bacterium]